MNTLKNEMEDYRILLRSVPSMVISVFILSVVCMNLLAGRELYRSDYFCINTGLALSWISFLCMDCICKRFGAKASIKISLLAIAVNIISVIMFKLLVMTPGHWAAYYSAPDPMAGEYIKAEEAFAEAEKIRARRGKNRQILLLCIFVFLYKRLDQPFCLWDCELQ